MNYNLFNGKKKIPKMVHQIFFNFFGELEENKIFHKSHTEFKGLEGFEYILWGEDECENLVIESFPEYHDLYSNFKYKIQKIDFVRFAILYKYGGMYVDLDMLPLKNPAELLSNNEENLIFHNIRHVKKNYSYIENDFMASVEKNDFWVKICEYCNEQYFEKMKMDIYDTWKGRFILQTTGPKMLSRFVRGEYPKIKPKKLVYTKWNKDSDENYYFKDYKLNTWIKNKDKKVI
tara:strand:+ start:2357 stop:3055 length:699 start_codon:yes stop_codon:yes gene_type:complete